MTDDIQQAADAYREHGSIRAASRATGVPYTTMNERVKKAAERGLLGYAPTLPGFRVAQVTSTPRGDFIQQKPERGNVFEFPAGHVAKGVSALVDPEGRVIQQWIKTRQDGADIDWPALFRGAFAEFEGRALPAPTAVLHDTRLLNLIPVNDWHLNMLAWKREVGENWDLKIAENIIGTATLDAIARMPTAHTGIVLGGGDLLHNDDNTNRTAKGNVLDVDGRHLKGLEAAQRLMVRTINATLHRNQHVIVRILPGNHDEYSSAAISHFLAAWYRLEPRVSVDLDADIFFWRRFGLVFLGATHGRTVKLARMPMIMAHRRAEDWGASKYRYVHGFHIHHHSKTATEGNGVICESHEAPIPKDAWHYGAGYLSGRCVKIITYHCDYGEVSRVRVAIPDGAGNRNTMREAA